MRNSSTKVGFNTSAMEKARFFRAVSGNEAAIVLQFLMNRPKDACDWKSDDGLTALMLAARDGHKETAWLLIHGGANLEAGNENGSTALMFAAHGGKATVAVQLLEAGANVNHVNVQGHTALMSAAANGFRNTAEQLLKFNADVNAKDKDGNTALDFARENGFTEIVQMIEAAASQQAAAREKAAAEARAQAAAKNPFFTEDDNTAALRELEQKMRQAKLTK